MIHYSKKKLIIKIIPLIGMFLCILINLIYKIGVQVNRENVKKTPSKVM